MNPKIVMMIGKQLQ